MKPTLRLPLPAILFAVLAGAGCGGSGIKRTEAVQLPKTLKGGQVLEGVMYLDLNGNGWRDQSEPSIPDMSIMLDGLVPSVTDSCGQFAFSGLSEGFHRISVDPAEMPPVYEGAPSVSQNIRASKDTAKSRFEVAMVPPKSPVQITTRTQIVVRHVDSKSAKEQAAATEAEKQKALVAIREATQQLDRIKSSGYVVLVKDTVKRIEGSLVDARQLVEIGDPASGLRLAVVTKTSIEEARRRIEAETKSPLRW